VSRELTFELSDALLALGLRRYYQRRWLGWRMILLVLLVGALSLILARQHRENAAFWLVYAALFIGLTATLGLLSYRQHRRRLARLYGRGGDRRLTCRLDEAGLTLKAAAGEFSRPWATFPRLWRFRDVWLLIDSTNLFLPLPAEPLAGEPGEFLARKVREAGGRVA
jgi:hypothetical protein